MGNTLNKNSKMECTNHGLKSPAFICKHLLDGQGVVFLSQKMSLIQSGRLKMPGARNVRPSRSSKGVGMIFRKASLKLCRYAKDVLKKSSSETLNQK